MRQSRRIVLTCVPLFCMLSGQRALAQIGIPPSGPPPYFNCSTEVSVTPQLRGEGYTETVGDIIFICDGGVWPAPDTAIPAVNITMFLNTAVTSRLLPSTAPGNSTNQSEALLIIDEPGSGLPNILGFGVPFGVGAPQTVCPTPATGCREY